MTDITAYIKRLIANDFMCSAVSVEGELSNVKYHSSGHIYFTLKDTGAALSCVMFSSSAKGLSFRLKDGDKIIVSGRIDVYEQQGKYQLYVRTARQAGLGELYAEYERIKAELEAMGMFDATYKRKVPRLVKTLGVVTSETGAVRRDIENVTRRRNPYVQILLYPVQVQGDGAKESIANGLRAIAAYHPDVIIVGRGGGSMEDLWAFNSIEVAQAVFESQIPVISAVGHETDTTICDYVADLRAPTPSAAAELAVADVFALEDEIAHKKELLLKFITGRIRTERLRIDRARAKVENGSPRNRISLRRQQIQSTRKELQRLMSDKISIVRREVSDNNAAMQYYFDDKLDQTRSKIMTAEDMLTDGMQRRLQDARHHLQLAARGLDQLSPLKKLGGGYAYVGLEDGGHAKSVKQIEVGQSLSLQFADGSAKARVEDVTIREN
ncbi:MAG: exodeoxyribonuclease VII large subunit [Lachnospiraceae bacterium]|nr:exodeoxyribonuclease VII large subunit [Lachnospiraceae bacterium]